MATVDLRGYKMGNTGLEYQPLPKKVRVRVVKLFWLERVPGNLLLSFDTTLNSKSNRDSNVPEWLGRRTGFL